MKLASAMWKIKKMESKEGGGDKKKIPISISGWLDTCTIVLNIVIIWFSGLQSVWRSCKEGYIHVSIATISLQCWYSPDSTTLVGTRTDWVFRSHKVRRTFPISYFFCHIRQYLWIKKFRIHVYKVLNLDFEQPARILTTSACYFL